VDGEIESSPFEKYDPLLHVGLTAAKSRTRRGKQVKTEVLSIAFIKKYIQYSKSKPAPVLTKGAANHIVNVYANLRNEDEGQTNRKKVVFFLCLDLCPVFDGSYPDSSSNSTYTRNPYSSIHCPR